jgi:hypothetical protein
MGDEGNQKQDQKDEEQNLCIPADAPAIPPKPKAAATKAMIKNTRAQYNMARFPFVKRPTKSAACFSAPKQN